eukprot:6182803-Amphidinium_carterae.1
MDAVTGQQEFTRRLSIGGNMLLIGWHFQPRHRKVREETSPTPHTFVSHDPHGRWAFCEHSMPKGIARSDTSCLKLLGLLDKPKLEE